VPYPEQADVAEHGGASGDTRWSWTTPPSGLAYLPRPLTSFELIR